MTKPARNPVLRVFLWICTFGASAAFAMVVATSAVFAETQTIDAQKAFHAVRNGELIILDIRSPGEWTETGVVQGAWPVTMHDPTFGSTLQDIFAKYPDRPIALICATGGRSNYVAGVLEENGISVVFDISEGMFGNGDAPGWIARGLPITNVRTAQDNREISILKKD